ncbi:MAG TPA: ABC transporter ATP-binding protein, partial [Nitriliruptorales bacterium]|nr:ABC transporter ATP-binding protein [Nitriliruptorales bacterium]
MWPWLAGAVGLGFLSSLIAALQPLPLKLLVDNALGPEPAPDPVARAIAWVDVAPSPVALVLVATASSLLLSVTAAAAGGTLSWLWEYAGRRMIRDLTVDLFDRLQRRSLSQRRSEEMGDTLSRLSTDTWSIYSMTHAVVSAPFERLLTVGAVCFAAWRLSPHLTLVTLGVALPFGALTRRQATRLRPTTLRDREAQARVTTSLNQLLATMPTVQAFAAESRSWATLRHLMGNAVVTGRRRALTNAAVKSAAGLLTSASTAVVLIVGGTLVIRGGASLGTLLAFVAYLRILDSQSRRLFGTHRTLLEGWVGLERVLQLWGQEPVIVDPVDPVVLPPAGPVGARVELIGITVGYQPGRPVLCDLDLVIEPG